LYPRAKINVVDAQLLVKNLSILRVNIKSIDNGGFGGRGMLALDIVPP